MQSLRRLYKRRSGRSENGRRHRPNAHRADDGSRDSAGLLDLPGKLLQKYAADSSISGIFPEFFPLIFIRLFSSSAATGLVLDIFKTYGTDSLAGRITSILMSCTETCFYTMSVYFMTARVSKSRYTLAGALFSTAVGVVMSVLLAYLM